MNFDPIPAMLSLEVLLVAMVLIYMNSLVKAAWQIIRTGEG